MKILIIDNNINIFNEKATQLAEVLSKPLELTVITLRAMGLDPVAFNWIERPDEQALQAAGNDLRHLGALVGPKSTISELGKLIADLQIDPSLARLVYCGCKQGSGEEAAVLAGLLSVGGNIFWRKPGCNLEEKKHMNETHASFYNNNGDAVTLYRLYKMYLEVLEGTKEFAMEIEEEKYEAFLKKNEKVPDDVLISQLKFLTLEDNTAVEEMTSDSSVITDDETESVSTAAETDISVTKSTDFEDAAVSQSKKASLNEVKALKSNKIAGLRRAKAWCATNFVNSKSLGIAISTSKDFIRAAKALAVWKEKDQSGQLTDFDIRRLVAKGYLLNVAKLSGSSTRGMVYSILRNDRMSTGQLHPGSALTVASRSGPDVPIWIVFQSVLQTSSTFLSVCTPIEEQWIEEDSLEFAVDVKKRSAIVPSQIIIDSISPGLMRKLMGKGFANLPVLEDTLGVDIVADNKYSRIVLWCPPSKNVEEVKKKIELRVSEVRLRAANETCEELLCGSTRAVFGSGCEVLHILSGNTFISINIANLPKEMTDIALKALGERYGPVREVSILPCRATEQRDGLFGRIVFDSSSHAATALESLRSELVGGKVLRVSAGGVRSPTAASAATSQLIMSWSIAPSKGSALLSFTSFTEANLALKFLKEIPISYNVEVKAVGCMITQKVPQPGKHMLSALGNFTGIDSAGYAKMSGKTASVKADQYQLRLKGLTSATDEITILDHLKRSSNVVKPSYIRVEREATASTEISNTNVAHELNTELMVAVPLIHAVDTCTSFFQQDRNRAGFIVEYRGGSDDVINAGKQWDANQRLATAAGTSQNFRQGQPIRVEVKHTTTLFVNTELYKTMSVPLKDLQSKVEQQGATIQILEKGSSMRFLVTSTDRLLLDAFTVSFNQLMVFTVFAPRESKDLLFSSNGRMKLTEISDKVTYIHYDNATRIIRVYGNDAARKKGIAALEEVIKMLSKDVESRTAYVIPTHWRTINKKRYDLIKRMDLLDLTINGMKLTASGSSTALDKVFLELKGLITMEVQACQHVGAVDDCLICYGPIEDDNYELSVCNHSYCTGCLQRQFSSAGQQQDISLPVVCFKCRSPYSYSDILALAPTPALSFMKHSAVEKYLLNNSTKYTHCVAPSCEQILDLSGYEIPVNASDEKRLGGRAVDCHTCGISYCLHCSERDGKPVSKHLGYDCTAVGSTGGVDFYVHFNKINSLLCLRCPRCSQVFIDFTGCFALKCSNGACGCNFCGFCLKDCGSDSHSHVSQCCDNPTKGDYFNTAEYFNKIHSKKRCVLVSEYLDKILDAKHKAALISHCEVSFRDLGIDPGMFKV